MTFTQPWHVKRGQWRWLAGFISPEIDRLTLWLGLLVGRWLLVPSFAMFRRPCAPPPPPSFPLSPSHVCLAPPSALLRCLHSVSPLSFRFLLSTAFLIMTCRDGTSVLLDTEINICQRCSSFYGNFLCGYRRWCRRKR